MRGLVAGRSIIQSRTFELSSSTSRAVIRRWRVRTFARTTKLPGDAIVHYVLARYATTGSGGMLERGPTIIARLDAPVARAECTNDRYAMLLADCELRNVMSWWRALWATPVLTDGAHVSSTPAVG